MHLRVWRPVMLTAAFLVSLSFWTRLPAAWRWPSAGVLAFVALLFAAISFVTARRRRSERLRPSAKPKSAPRLAPRPSRRGPIPMQPVMSRDAIRMAERIGRRDLPGLPH